MKKRSHGVQASGEGTFEAGWWKVNVVRVRTSSASPGLPTQ